MKKNTGECVVRKGPGGGALVARPAEILDDAVGRIRDSVNLFPGVPARVGNPNFRRSRPESETPRLSQTVRDNSLRVHVDRSVDGRVRVNRRDPAVEPAAEPPVRT